MDLAILKEKNVHSIGIKNKYFGQSIYADRTIQEFWRLMMNKRTNVIKEFEEAVERVEFSLSAKSFLNLIRDLFRKLDYPKTISLQNAEQYFKLEFETPESGYESILALLVLAYNTNRDALLKQLTFIIDWHTKIGKQISVDVILEILGECSISEQVGLTTEQQQVCDFISRHPELSEKEVHQLFNASRLLAGKKEISMPTFINHVRALKSKLRFRIVPGFDYYRLGLFPMMIKLWITKPLSPMNPTIVHPYIRYTNVLFEDKSKKLIQIGIIPPREHVKDFIRDLKNNPYVDTFQVYCYQHTTDGLNARYISRIAHSWEVNERNIESIFSHTPLEFISDQYLLLPRTFEYWHDWVDFTKERGERTIPLDYEKLLVIHGLWKSVGLSKKLKVSPYSVVNLYEQSGLKLSYKRVMKIVKQLEKQQVFRWRPFTRLFSTQLLTVFIDRPSEELEFLIKSSLNYLPQYSLLSTYDYEYPRNRQLLIEINIPKATSLPFVYSSFLRKHQHELDDFIVSRTVRRTHAQLPLFSLWDVEENKWKWDATMELEIVPVS